MDRKRSVFHFRRTGCTSTWGDARKRRVLCSGDERSLKDALGYSKAQVPVVQRKLVARGLRTD